MKKPRSLKKGSKIALLSPSSGLANSYKSVYNEGLKTLKEIFKFNILEMPTSFMTTDELYRNPILRAKDINDAFRNSTVDGIIINIGGSDSIRILQYLDTNLILNNPKFIMGFSDSTTILSYFNMLGMVTFYGPSVMAGLAQLRNLPTAYKKHLKSFLLDMDVPYTYRSYDKWCAGYPDWENPKLSNCCNELIPNTTPYTFLQGNNSTIGYFWGGCIETLEFMKGTSYWPKDDFWNNKILVFETSEDKPTPNQIKHWLRNYGVQGILNKVKGIVWGKPYNYSEEECRELYQILVQVVQHEFNSNIPIVINFDFGHTDPKLLLPFGAKVSLNPYEGTIILIENPYNPF